MMNVEIGQIVTQIIAFLIMLAILKRFAWKPLLALMKEREDMIRNEFELIDKRKLEITALRESYEEKLHNIEMLAKKLGQEEVNRARVQAREIESEAHQRGREIIQKAQSSTEIALEKARAELKEELIKLTMAALEAILPKNISKEKQQQLVSQYISEIDFK